MSNDMRSMQDMFNGCPSVEATKPKSAAECAAGPCDCDPHRETCDQCAPYLHEAKPQEPLGTAAQLFDDYVIDQLGIDPTTWVFTTPQPCQSCQLTAAEMSEAHAEGFTDPGYVWSSYKGLKAKCAELEAECGFDQRNAAASQKEASMLLDKVEILEAERDALKAENTALISSGLKNEAERGNDGFLITKIADLVQERDALAMQVAKMRDAINKDCRYIDNDGLFCCGICGHVLGGKHHDKCVMALPDNTEAIIKRHDAAVLRKAAEVCESRQTPGTGSVAILSGAADELRRMAAELEKS